MTWVKSSFVENKLRAMCLPCAPERTGRPQPHKALCLPPQQQPPQSSWASLAALHSLEIPFMEQRVSISHPRQTHLSSESMFQSSLTWEDGVKWGILSNGLQLCTLLLYSLSAMVYHCCFIINFLSRYEQNTILEKPMLVVSRWLFNSLCQLGSGVS